MIVVNQESSTGLPSGRLAVNIPINSEPSSAPKFGDMVTIDFMHSFTPSTESADLQVGTNIQDPINITRDGFRSESWSFGCDFTHPLPANNFMFANSLTFPMPQSTPRPNPNQPTGPLQGFNTQHCIMDNGFQGHGGTSPSGTSNLQTDRTESYGMHNGLMNTSRAVLSAGSSPYTDRITQDERDGLFYCIELSTGQRRGPVDISDAFSFLLKVFSVPPDGRLQNMQNSTEWYVGQSQLFANEINFVQIVIRAYDWMDGEASTTTSPVTSVWSPSSENQSNNEISTQRFELQNSTY